MKMKVNNTPITISFFDTTCDSILSAVSLSTFTIPSDEAYLDFGLEVQLWECFQMILVQPLELLHLLNECAWISLFQSENFVR